MTFPAKHHHHHHHHHHCHHHYQYHQPRSQGPFYFEKVPWVQLVTCLCMPTQAAQRVDPQLNFVNIL